MGLMKDSGQVDWNWVGSTVLVAAFRQEGYRAAHHIETSIRANTRSQITIASEVAVTIAALVAVSRVRATPTVAIEATVLRQLGALEVVAPREWSTSSADWVMR